MALLPYGCSPRPDDILGQVQEESKSLFLFPSGHMLRSIGYPDEYHPQALSLVCADTVCADQNKPMIPVPGGSIITSPAPSWLLGDRPLCKTNRPLPQPPCLIEE